MTPEQFLEESLEDHEPRRLRGLATFPVFRGCVRCPICNRWVRVLNFQKHLRARGLKLRVLNYTRNKLLAFFDTPKQCPLCQRSVASGNFARHLKGHARYSRL